MIRWNGFLIRWNGFCEPICSNKSVSEIIDNSLSLHRQMLTWRCESSVNTGGDWGIINLSSINDAIFCIIIVAVRRRFPLVFDSHISVRLIVIAKGKTSPYMNSFSGMEFPIFARNLGIGLVQIAFVANGNSTPRLKLQQWQFPLPFQRLFFSPIRASNVLV